MSSDLQWITARLSLAIAKLQTHDPASQREAARDIVDAQVALWDLLDEVPGPFGLARVVNGDDR